MCIPGVAGIWNRGAAVALYCGDRICRRRILAARRFRIAYHALRRRGKQRPDKESIRDRNYGMTQILRHRKSKSTRRRQTHYPESPGAARGAAPRGAVRNRAPGPATFGRKYTERPYTDGVVTKHRASPDTGTARPATHCGPDTNTRRIPGFTRRQLRAGSWGRGGGATATTVRRRYYAIVRVSRPGEDRPIIPKALGQHAEPRREAPCVTGHRDIRPEIYRAPKYRWRSNKTPRVARHRYRPPCDSLRIRY